MVKNVCLLFFCYASKETNTRPRNMALIDKYIDLFTDFGFKKLFGTEPNKDLFIDFLNQLLPPRHQISELSYTPTE